MKATKQIFTQKATMKPTPNVCDSTSNFNFDIVLRFMIGIVVWLVCSTSIFDSVDAQDKDQGFNSADMDRDIRIQDDLFRHVNGNWLKTTEIPKDKSNFGSFGKLADLSQKRIRKIIEKTVAQASEAEHPKGSNPQKIADLYKSFMDVERVEELGFKPLASELEKIQALENHEAIWEHFGYLNRMGVSSPVGFGAVSYTHLTLPTICSV